MPATSRARLLASLLAAAWLVAVAACRAFIILAWLALLSRYYAFRGKRRFRRALEGSGLPPDLVEELAAYYSRALSEKLGVAGLGRVTAALASRSGPPLLL